MDEESILIPGEETDENNESEGEGEGEENKEGGNSAKRVIKFNI